MKYRNRYISAFVLSLSLSACSTQPQTVTKPAYQQNLLTPCPTTLPHLTDGTGRDVAITMRDWARTYHRCQIRHNGLVKAVKDDLEAEQ